MKFTDKMRLIKSGEMEVDHVGDKFHDQTALSEACMLNRKRAIKYLIDAGADPDDSGRMFSILYRLTTRGVTASMGVRDLTRTIYMLLDTKRVCSESLCSMLPHCVDYPGVVDKLLRSGASRCMLRYTSEIKYHVKTYHRGDEICNTVRSATNGFEKRLCLIVADELGRRYNTIIFLDLRIWDYLV